MSMSLALEINNKTDGKTEQNFIIFDIKIWRLFRIKWNCWINWYVAKNMKLKTNRSMFSYNLQNSQGSLKVYSRIFFGKWQHQVQIEGMILLAKLYT